ncbi:MAG: nickel pincer cofactor biosynthesis protein LarB [Oscillospiraceae bacterium]|jgi:NCAIR mutase (PurE)-related protein|nr:nickel pincer cofactor biosynthesis protein LarB [Oscillospiraceae bacterium]
MDPSTRRERTLRTLRQVRDGSLQPEDALDLVAAAPFEDIGYANIDLHRQLRQGMGEVVYGAGKTPSQIAGIVSAMAGKGLVNIMVTRVSQAGVDAVEAAGIPVQYHGIARLAVAVPARIEPLVGNIVIASGGTSDMPVCEEASLVCETLGDRVTRVYDVGVAGLHRLLAKLDILAKARVVVVVAGMEGALASVVGGLVGCPVVAVPTSVGYGANFGGLSALLSMLNSCASGVSVVNIDNGFGAAVIASRINRMEGIV